MTLTLTDTEALRKGFEAQGFMSADLGVIGAEYEVIRDALNGILSRRDGWTNGDLRDLTGHDASARQLSQPQILMPHHLAPQLEKLVLREKARALARAVLGAEPQDEGEHAIIKPAYSEQITPLHQDEAFWSGDVDYSSVSVWISLDDVDARNGCMRFVPGSHLGQISPHHSYLGQKENNSFEIDNPDQFNVVDCPLRRGEAVVHHCRTIHGAHRNATARARVAYVFGFGLKPQRSTTPRHFHWQETSDQACVARSRANGHEPTKMRAEVLE
jgi:ectoine hydroxylase-related dioxygenase (phytanoyl-CoA dioxygenase family)